MTLQKFLGSTVADHLRCKNGSGQEENNIIASVDVVLDVPPGVHCDMEFDTLEFSLYFYWEDMELSYSVNKHWMHLASAKQNLGTTAFRGMQQEWYSQTGELKHRHTYPTDSTTIIWCKPKMVCLLSIAIVFFFGVALYSNETVIFYKSQ